MLATRMALSYELRLRYIIKSLATGWSHSRSSKSSKLAIMLVLAGGLLAIEALTLLLAALVMLALILLPIMGREMLLYYAGCIMLGLEAVTRDGA